MNDEMNYLTHNEVWSLLKLLEGCLPIICKWVFKSKHDTKGQVKMYKTRFTAKGYNQRECIDYKKIFSPVSTKNSLLVIMTIVAYFDLKFHQMDIKIIFFNGDITNDIYVVQPIDFEVVEKEDLVYKLKKSI